MKLLKLIEEKRLQEAKNIHSCIHCSCPKVHFNLDTMEKYSKPRRFCTCHRCSNCNTNNGRLDYDLGGFTSGTYYCYTCDTYPKESYAYFVDGDVLRSFRTVTKIEVDRNLEII